jgi:hypothetical protein
LDGPGLATKWPLRSDLGTLVHVNEYFLLFINTLLIKFANAYMSHLENVRNTVPFLVLKFFPTPSKTTGPEQFKKTSDRFPKHA